jgi:hypothetical protein
MEKLSTPATDVNPGEIKQASEIKNTNQLKKDDVSGQRLTPSQLQFLGIKKYLVFLSVSFQRENFKTTP